jgi:hypothetical protein
VGNYHFNHIYHSRSFTRVFASDCGLNFVGIHPSIICSLIGSQPLNKVANIFFFFFFGGGEV